jgi:ribosomal protein L11 methyltransferase
MIFTTSIKVFEIMNYVASTFRSGNKDIDWEVLMAFLGEIGYESFEEIEDGVLAYIPQADFDNLKVENLLADKFKGFDISFTYETIQDRNWNEVWESNYDAVVISNRCLIRAPFHPSDPNMEFEILIEPQMSFGTAHHETTAMMIAYILEADLKNKEILDMGSGTGVLAILASMKGAKFIDAIDIEEWAYKNCVANTEKNNVTNVKVVQGDASCIINKYDVIFANINLNILVQDMEVYASAMNADGIIYFSGFYQADLTKLERAANKANLQLVGSMEKNNWMAATFLKTK